MKRCKDELDYEINPYRRGAILAGQIDAKQMKHINPAVLRQELLHAGVYVDFPSCSCGVIYWRTILAILEGK